MQLNILNTVSIKYITKLHTMRKKFIKYNIQAQKFKNKIIWPSHYIIYQAYLKNRILLTNKKILHIES